MSYDCTAAAVIRSVFGVSVSIGLP